MSHTSSARCSCGHDIHHEMVTHHEEYTWWGWVRIFYGVSAHPTRVRYQCLSCDETFHTETDPNLIRDKRRHD